MATFWIYPIDRVFQDDGELAPGSEAYFYEPGTTTPKTVYRDTALAVAHSSPVVSDAFGVFPAVYIEGAGGLKVDIQYNSASLSGYPRDKVSGFPIGGLGADSVPFTPTTRISDTITQDAIESVDRKIEIEDAANSLVGTTGSANAYLLDTDISNYALATGDVHLLEASFANSGACTLNVDSTGPKSIKFRTGGVDTDPASGEIAIGHILRVRYDGTSFIVLDHWRALPTKATAEAGLDNSTLMTPLRTAEAVAAQALQWTEATLQTTTSGSSKDFLSITANVKQIVIHFNAISTNGTSSLLLQVGDSGGMETSGYTASAFSGASAYSTAGFILTNGVGGAGIYSGQVTLTLMDDATNTWTAKGDIASTAAGFNSSAGSKSLSATLDRLRITTVNGTDAFDAGSVNITYMVSNA